MRLDAVDRRHHRARPAALRPVPRLPHLTVGAPGSCQGRGARRGDVADAAGRGATLTDRQRAALALADAEMSQPAACSAHEVVASCARRFPPDELVELTLDVMKWNYQKVGVALGIDDEVRPGALTDLSFDADGHAIL